MAETIVTLKKEQIKAAIAQAAMVQLGVAPATPGVQAFVRLSEMIDVFSNAEFSASVKVTVPDAAP